MDTVEEHPSVRAPRSVESDAEYATADSGSESDDGEQTPASQHGQASVQSNPADDEPSNDEDKDRCSCESTDSSGAQDSTESDSKSRNQTGTDSNTYFGEQTVGEAGQACCDSDACYDDSCESEEESKEEKLNKKEKEEKRRQEQESEMTEEEREKLKRSAQELKKSGNDLFNERQFTDASNLYTKALIVCPLCYHKERAVMLSNRAACHMKMERYDQAIQDSTDALVLNPHYVKALLRRAELYERNDKLDEALEDYQKVVELDRSIHSAGAACMRLPEQIKDRNEKLKTEMMGKLKDLGNMVLKPFGLSTDNFKLQQDPNTGSYSVSMQK